MNQTEQNYYNTVWFGSNQMPTPNYESRTLGAHHGLISAYALETRAGKTGHRVVFVSCQLRVVSNLSRPKPDPFNNRVKILRPKPDMEK
ncbi:hypothetical protein WN943_023129 [Citrus x changshan-huyou]